MHDAAYQWVKRAVELYEINNHAPKVAIELGAYNVNGSVRDLFPTVERWIGVDVRPGPDVDVVMPAEEFVPNEPVDLVVCTEVLEHTPNWRAIVYQSFYMLREGGELIVTAAGPTRAPHGCNGGNVGAEYYWNINEDDLAEAFKDAGFVHCEISVTLDGTDVYAVGGRPVEDGAL